MSDAMTPEQAMHLLKAGAVLPPGTEGAGERAVPLTARAYRHPGLDDRTVVRLTPGELGAAEDAAAGFLGLIPEGEPVEVGVGLRQSLGFPEWVLVYHPEDGHQALALLPELERAAKQAKSKPKAALTTYLDIAGRLASALPHFLPTFYEQAGRVFVGVENTAYASQMFTKARAAESQHGLDLDEDRLDDVFLEYALAGALPVKALVDYSKVVSERIPAAEAMDRFAKLCARRTMAGLTPSGRLATELRRLARAAGADADAMEQQYLAGLLTLPATLRAPIAWWKGHRAAIVALAQQDPAVRHALLTVMPTDYDLDLPVLWLGILVESGAAAALQDDAPADAALPDDGAVGWLRRFQGWRGSHWRARGRMPELYALIERCAGRLRTELAAAGAALPVGDDLDLLDLMLALELPVADPDENTALPLEAWARDGGRRDLAAVEADARFRPAFRRAADGFDPDDSGRRTIKKLIASPGGRPMLAEWVAEVAARFQASGLPGLPDAMSRLGWLPGEALMLAEAEVRAAAATDLAPVLARTLRAGLLDEFGWPAWEEAAAELASDKNVENLVVADAWPHLIVAGSAQARVIDGEGTVLTHDLRIPAKDDYDLPGFHYVDGELQVHWRSRALDGRLRGYWHNSADQFFAVERSDASTRGLRMYYYGPGRLDRSLPVPGGGRTTGAAPLHRGDTALPDDRTVISDGTSFWVWGWGGLNNDALGWYEFDPTTGERGRQGMPGFLSDAVRTAPAGTEFVHGWVLPTVSSEPGPADRPVDGLVGFRVTKRPDGTFHSEDLAGVSLTEPQDFLRAVVFPGDDTPRALVGSGSYDITLLDAEGVVVAQAKTDGKPGTYAKGTRILPPISFWQYLRPRDHEGSLALRRIDRDTAAALVAAGGRDVDKKALRDRLRELLPQVSNEALLKGIAGVVRHAAEQQVRLNRVSLRLERALVRGQETEEFEVSGPADQLLNAALGGLYQADNWRSRSTEPLLFAALRIMGREIREAPERPYPIHTHLDGPDLPNTGLWKAVLTCAPALALRSVSPFVEAEQREALRELLAELDALRLLDSVDTSPWRRCKATVKKEYLTLNEEMTRDSWRGLLPLDGGAFFAVLDNSWNSDDCEFTGLFHDPQGRFELPEPYTLKSVKPIGAGRDAGWLAGFVAEAAERQTTPWFPAAAEEFAELTGVTPTTARLVVAGLPRFDRTERGFLPRDLCAVLGVKSADAAIARQRLTRLGQTTARALVTALLPADPSRLWTRGPDTAAAAEAWNRLVGRQKFAVPEALTAQTHRAVKVSWDLHEGLPAVLDPASSPMLGNDLKWHIKGDRARQADEQATGFTARTLTGAIPLVAWLAHRLPAGDPVRAALPAALEAVRDRLANPELLLDLDRYVGLTRFRTTAGPATELGKGFERYGAVVMATHDDQPAPALRVSLLDAAGTDPYLPALRAEDQVPFPAEIALRLVRDPRFAALLADPGDPAALDRDPDGTWSPQDPTRSVPELVAEAAKELGIGEDAAAVYLMLLAMPDPTDRNAARWTGWKPARLKAARAELAGTGFVVEGSRSRAGRSLFLPGGWLELKSPHVPMEAWKAPFFEGLLHERTAVAGVVVPVEPVAELYRRAWDRARGGDWPRFEQLKTRRAARARRR